MTPSNAQIPGLESYFRAQQVPLQWSFVLRALAQVLRETSGDDVAALRELFRSAGARLAGELSESLKSVRTLEELAEVFNGLWSEISWGVASLREESGAIVIEHHFAPLSAAFGAEHIDWSVGLLEGAYSEGFALAGGGPAFSARCTRQDDEGLRLTFVYAPKH